MLKFDPTTPDGRPSLTVDFTKLLPTGVTVSSCTVECAVRATSPSDDSTPSDRLDGSPSVVSPNVSQFFHNGVDGVDYYLSFIATFSDGQIEVVEAEIQVRADD